MPLESSGGASEQLGIHGSRFLPQPGDAGPPALSRAPSALLSLPESVEIGPLLPPLGFSRTGSVSSCCRAESMAESWAWNSETFSVSLIYSRHLAKPHCPPSPHSQNMRTFISFFLFSFLSIKR